LRIVGFVGPSGTGKSYRALWVAKERGIEYIIDDGLLISGNKIISGKSAKRESTKIGSVKTALFTDVIHANEVKKVIAKIKPGGILILGTSDGMVEKIAKTLEIGDVKEKVYIDQVASEFEIKEALSCRKNQGKHVIPVPNFEIKQDFSGFMVDPLQIFRRKGKGHFQHVGEKTVVRPTFSYLGKYTISDYTIYQLINHVASRLLGIKKISKYRLTNRGEGLYIDVDVVMYMGSSVYKTLQQLQNESKNEIERLTSLNVLVMNVTARSIVFK